MTNLINAYDSRVRITRNLQSVLLYSCDLRSQSVYRIDWALLVTVSCWNGENKGEEAANGPFCEKKNYLK